MSDWKPEDFHRRTYKVQQTEKKELDRAQRIEATVKIDGKPFINIELREPGMLAIVSRPDDPDGFAVEIVEPGGKRFVDLRLPRDVPKSSEPSGWTRDALFGDEQ